MRRIEKSHLPVQAYTHAGMRGKNNEDRYGVSAFQMEGAGRPKVLLAVLADGIGGHRAGEVAAEMAVDVISAVVADKGGKLPPPQLLQSAIQTAGQAIYKQARSNNHQEGMGATTACALIVGLRLYTASVGDSRIYLLRDGSLRQLTTDHTWVQEALERGILKPEETHNHPNAHVIRRFLGSPQPPEPDLRLRLRRDEDDAQALANQGLQLRGGDIILLCSDGLTDLVRDEEISSALLNHPIDHAAQELINLANSRGGHDNITLILIQVPRRSAKNMGTLPAWIRAGCLTLALVVLFSAGLAVGLPQWLGQETPTPTAQPATLDASATQPLPSAATPLASPAGTDQPGPILTLPARQVTPTTSPSGSEATLTPWPTNTTGP